MRESIGGAYIINTIAIFIVLVFAFLAGTVIYYKAYKVNIRIAGSIEKYEGYNSYSYNEINNILKTIGYTKAKDLSFSECKSRRGIEPSMRYTHKYAYCIYELPTKNNYYKYGIVTYIKFKIDTFNFEMNLPIYYETERIYHFNEKDEDD